MFQWESLKRGLLHKPMMRYKPPPSFFRRDVRREKRKKSLTLAYSSYGSDLGLNCTVTSNSPNIPLYRGNLHDLSGNANKRNWEKEEIGGGGMERLQCFGRAEAHVTFINAYRVSAAWTEGYVTGEIQQYEALCEMENGAKCWWGTKLLTGHMIVPKWPLSYCEFFSLLPLIQIVCLHTRACILWLLSVYIKLVVNFDKTTFKHHCAVWFRTLMCTNANKRNGENCSWHVRDLSNSSWTLFFLFWH